MNKTLLTFLLLTISLHAPFADDLSRRKELGRSEKLRILVDKVMQPQAKWNTEEWMVRAAADAGFNVFSPRKGFDDREAVKRVSAWCAAHHLYHLPWMRGSLDVPLNDPHAAGKRVVWASGAEQPLWSVNSDEFWEWTTRYIVDYARLSVDYPALMGVFLDYENYAPGAEDNLYALSYDDVILARFAANMPVEIPAMALADRKSWLETQGLHDRFAEFQVRHWRERCRALRQAVDALNPAFQFCIYPAPGTPFMVQAAYPEWATESAPIILADASTYGRPSRFRPEQESLEINRKLLLDRMETPKNAGIPFIYTGGIDPVVRGADPEFSGKNAVMCAETTGGYWIFYEGPTYTKQDHQDYWKWFSWANAKIAQGQFDAQRQPRETPESFFSDIFSNVDMKSIALPSNGGAEKKTYPPAKLRGDNLLLVAGRQGVPVEVVLQHHPLAHYQAPLTWELRGTDLQVIASGNIAQAQTGPVPFTPVEDGVLLLAVSAGSCAYSVLSSTAPTTLYTGAKASFIGPVQRLYFAVPKGVDSFKIIAQSGGQETVRVNIFDAQAQPLATGQTSPKEPLAEIAVPHNSDRAEICALETTRAEVGVVEDYTLSLGPNLAPGVSLLPEHVFLGGTPP